MQAVGDLAGGIAHDFNNALTGIIGFAELLRLRIPDDPKVRGDLDEILRCAERASTLTKQLLAFARRQVIEPVRLSLNAVVTDLLRLMRKVAGEQIEVRTELSEGIPSIVADRGQLEQVMMNLCLNSRDAMPKGGRFIVSTGVMTPPEDSCAGTRSCLRGGTSPSKYPIPVAGWTKSPGSAPSIRTSRRRPRTRGPASDFRWCTAS
jgi:signal transduction histidine kinase